MFSLLAPEHMQAEAPAPPAAPTTNPSSGTSSLPSLHTASPSLPRPSSVFLGGKVHTWSPEACPYIGGGYCSPIAGHGTTAGAVLAQPLAGGVFFAGEATSEGAGASVHAAMATGLRAASQVSAFLLQEGIPRQL